MALIPKAAAAEEAGTSAQPATVRCCCDATPAAPRRHEAGRGPQIPNPLASPSHMESCPKSPSCQLGPCLGLHWGPSSEEQGRQAPIPGLADTKMKWQEQSQEPLEKPP